MAKKMVRGRKKKKVSAKKSRPRSKTVAKKKREEERKKKKSNRTKSEPKEISTVVAGGNGGIGNETLGELGVVLANGKLTVPSVTDRSLTASQVFSIKPPKGRKPDDNRRGFSVFPDKIILKRLRRMKDGSEREDQYLRIASGLM